MPEYESESGVALAFYQPLAHPRNQSSEGGKGVLKIPRTKRPAHPTRLQIIHQLNKTRLRLLRAHGFALDGFDFIRGCEAGFGSWEAADVVENVD